MGYSIKEASQIIGVTDRQVRRYLRDGKLHGVLVMGKYGEAYSIDVIPPDLIKRKATEQSPDFPPGMISDLIKGLQEENRNLAGQLGVAQERVRNLEDQVKLLTTHKVRWYKRLFSRG